MLRDAIWHLKEIVSSSKEYSGIHLSTICQEALMHLIHDRFSKVTFKKLLKRIYLEALS